MRSSSNCTFLKNAINKYGKNNFKIEVIEECFSLEELDLKESYFIKELNTLAPNGYNLTTGGAAPKHSDITKEKMSKTRKGKHPSWATEASRSEESKQRRSESHLALGNSGWTEERRENARKPAMIRAKKIKDQDGVIYNSLTEAALLTGCHRSAIQYVLSGKYKKTKNKDKKEFTFLHHD